MKLPKYRSIPPFHWIQTPVQKWLPLGGLRYLFVRWGLFYGTERWTKPRNGTLSQTEACNLPLLKLPLQFISGTSSGWLLALNQAKFQNSKINQISIISLLCMWNHAHSHQANVIWTKVVSCVCNFNVSSQTWNRTLTLITYHLRILGFLKCNISHVSLYTKQAKLVRLFSQPAAWSMKLQWDHMYYFVTVRAALCWIYSSWFNLLKLYSTSAEGL